jgi:hypothetical protein
MSNVETKRMKTQKRAAERMEGGSSRKMSEVER